MERQPREDKDKSYKQRCREYDDDELPPPGPGRERRIETIDLTTEGEGQRRPMGHINKTKDQVDKEEKELEKKQQILQDWSLQLDQDAENLKAGEKEIEKLEELFKKVELNMAAAEELSVTTSEIGKDITMVREAVNKIARIDESMQG